METEAPPVPLPPSPMSPDPEMVDVYDDRSLCWWATPLLTPVAVLPGLATIALAWQMGPAHGAWAGVRLAWPDLVWHGLALGVGVVAVDWLAPRGWPRAARWALGLGLAALVCPPHWWLLALPVRVAYTGPGIADFRPELSATEWGLFSLGWAFCGLCMARHPGPSAGAWLRPAGVGAASRVVAVAPLLGLAWMDALQWLHGGWSALACSPWLHTGTVVLDAASTGFPLGLALIVGLRLGRPRGDWRLSTPFRRLGQRLLEEVARIFS